VQIMSPGSCPKLAEQLVKCLQLQPAAGERPDSRPVAAVMAQRHRAHRFQLAKSQYRSLIDAALTMVSWLASRPDADMAG
jgi:hypothetical protein